MYLPSIPKHRCLKIIQDLSKLDCHDDFNHIARNKLAIRLAETVPWWQSLKISRSKCPNLQRAAVKCHSHSRECSTVAWQTYTISVINRLGMKICFDIMDHNVMKALCIDTDSDSLLFRSIHRMPAMYSMTLSIHDRTSTPDTIAINYQTKHRTQNDWMQPCMSLCARICICINVWQCVW